MKKTIFFGPFVGEFGWELLFWHDWVKRMCRTRYKDYYRIACSFPGRYPFYPEVDEFWPLPEDFLRNTISSRGYITDCWINGYPRPSINVVLPDICPLLGKVINDFKKKLPSATEFIHPWEFRYDKEDKKYYGVDIKHSPRSDDDFIAYNIPRQKQVVGYLNPTQKGIKILKTIISPEEKIISIFPRNRLFRRPDKNWSKENHEFLIKEIQKELPKFKIGILGEPGGAFFTDGVPAGCIDLINIDQNYRMDVQLAALKQSKLAIGSISGAILFVLASGCKAITWGGLDQEKACAKENFMNSPFIFLAHKNPSVNLIIKYVKWSIGGGVMPPDNLLRIVKIFFYRIINPRYFFLLKSRSKEFSNKLWKKKK